MKLGLFNSTLFILIPLRVDDGTKSVSEVAEYNVFFSLCFLQWSTSQQLANIKGAILINSVVFINYHQTSDIVIERWFGLMLSLFFVGPLLWLEL